MRGYSQSQLMRCDDGSFYVVKFRNNPQGERVLVNDFLGTRLATRIGLPAPQVGLIFVDEAVIKQSPGLYIQCGAERAPCEAGVGFGSRFPVHPFSGNILHYLPSEAMARVRNLNTFAGALAFDKWTANSDTRQAVFWRDRCERQYRAMFIDHGQCFNGAKWDFPDDSLQGTHLWNTVYRRVTGWENFEPWLSSIEEISLDEIAACARDIPRDWYRHSSADLASLVTQLHLRRGVVRELIEDFHESSRMPFPNWQIERPGWMSNDSVPSFLDAGRIEFSPEIQN
jgi:hypothetical protein